MPKADNKEPEIYPEKQRLALSMDVYMQIVRHWNQPFLLEKKDGELYERFVEFGQPDTEVDNLLKEEKIAPSDLNGLEEFYLRFRTVCKLAKKLADRPQKEDLKRSYKTRVKKLKKLLDDLNEELKSYTREEFAYLSDILQKQADYMLESANDQGRENILLNFCELMTVLGGIFHLHEAAENDLFEMGNRNEHEVRKILSEWDGSPECYLKNFEGGHGEAKSKKAALCAIAESYLICFNEMPTCSENSMFMKYGKVLYEYLGAGSKFESSLYQDAKAAIENLKSNKSKGLQK